MNNKEDKLPIEQEVYLRRVEAHISFLNPLLVAKTGILPLIASLSATMLIVATFNEKLIPLTEDIKVALTILLIIVPVSVIFAVIEFIIAINNTTEAINKLTGVDIFASKIWYRKLLIILVFYMPLFAGAVLSIIIGYIIFVLWR